MQIGRHWFLPKPPDPRYRTENFIKHLQGSRKISRKDKKEVMNFRDRADPQSDLAARASHFSESYLQSKNEKYLSST